MNVKFWEDFLHNKTTMLITIICTLPELTIFTHGMSVDTLKLKKFIFSKKLYKIKHLFKVKSPAFDCKLLLQI